MTDRLPPDEVRRRVLAAITDPGSVTPRKRERLYGEPVIEWQARAVMDVLPYLDVCAENERLRAGIEDAMRYTDSGGECAARLSAALDNNTTGEDH